MFKWVPSYPKEPGLDEKLRDILFGMSLGTYEGMQRGKLLHLSTEAPDIGTVEFDLVRDIAGSAAYAKTPLHLAAGRGHANVVKMLLDVGGASLQTRDEFERTPLISAAAGGYVDVVSLLLSAGGVDANSADIGAKSALSLATELGHERIVELLLDYENRPRLDEARVGGSSR